MSRPRKPSNVLELTGAFRKDPQRRRARQNELRDTRQLGPPPSCLTAAERKCWRELAANALPGVLGRSDRLAVECAARLMARMRAGQMATAAEFRNLASLLNKLGMDPSGRARVEVPPPAPRNPFDDDDSDDPNMVRVKVPGRNIIQSVPRSEAHLYEPLDS